MAKEEQVKAEEQEQVVESQDQGKSQDNGIEERLANLEKGYKSEIAGLNRKLSEKDDALKTYQREKMTETERIEAERKELAEERQKIANEKKALTTQKLVESELRGVGLSLDFAKRIHGETESEIKADVQALNDLFNSNVNKVVEKTVNERLAGKSPKSTEETKNTITRTEFDRLSEHERMTKIKAGVQVVEG